jgi:DhnA family fructose-bisphosphate aldolase class Ia
MKSTMVDCGKLIRLKRLLNPRTNKAVIVAFDHGLMLGPIPGTSPPHERLQLFLDAGVDAILLSLGLLRRSVDLFAGRRVGVILRLDWTNQWREPSMLGFDEGRTSALAAVEDAVRLGADAVLTYMFVGLDDASAEAQEVHRNAEVNRACERFGMVHIIESMARGRRVDQPNRKDLVAFHTRVAGELGADLIKTDILPNEQDTAEIVSTSLVPILLAGGPKVEESGVLDLVHRLVRAGASGIIYLEETFFNPQTPPLSSVPPTPPFMSEAVHFGASGREGARSTLWSRESASICPSSTRTWSWRAVAISALASRCRPAFK